MRVGCKVGSAGRLSAELVLLGTSIPIWTNRELAEKQLTCGEQIYQQLSVRGAEITSREWANSEALSCQDFLERSGNADQPSFSLSGRLTSPLPH